MHLGLLPGLVTEASDSGDRAKSPPAMSVQLDPFVEPELCLARVVAE
jgi:hypothetical protein